MRRGGRWESGGEIIADKDEEKGIRVLRASSSRPSEATVSVLSWISALTTTIEPVNPLSERRARASLLLPVLLLRDVPAQTLPNPAAACSCATPPPGLVLAGDGENTGRILGDTRPLRIGPARRRTRAKDGEPAARAASFPVARRRPEPAAWTPARWASRRRYVVDTVAGTQVSPRGSRGRCSSFFRTRAQGGRREVRVRGRRRRRRTLQRYRPSRLARSPRARGGCF